MVCRVSQRLLFEVEVVVVPAAGVERCPAAGTLVRAAQVFHNCKFGSADATQNGWLIPVWPRPYLDRVAGQGFVAVLASIVAAAALHLDCDDVDRLSVVKAAGLSVNIKSVHIGSRTLHT